MFVYMKVTRDRYELPVAVADTGDELAKLCGVSIHNVYNAIRKARLLGHNCQYVRVDIGEEENVKSK